MFSLNRHLIAFLFVTAIVPPLCGMESDKEATLKSYQTTDYFSYFDFYQQLYAVDAEAFADEYQDFLLDADFNIKQEYVDIVLQCKEEERNKILSKIEQTKTDRQTRIEADIKKMYQEQDETLEYIKNHPQDIDTINDSCKAIFSVVKNGEGKILGKDLPKSLFAQLKQ